MSGLPSLFWGHLVPCTLRNAINQTPLPLPVVLVSNSIYTKQTEHENHSSNSHQGEGLADLVDRSWTSVRGCFFCSPYSQQDDYRCLLVGLGVSHGWPHGTEHLDVAENQNVRKCSETQSSLRNLQSFRLVMSYLHNVR